MLVNYYKNIQPQRFYGYLLAWYVYKIVPIYRPPFTARTSINRLDNINYSPTQVSHYYLLTKSVLACLFRKTQGFSMFCSVLALYVTEYKGFRI